MNLKHIASHWTALHEALGLGRPIKSKAEYTQALAFVEQVFDAGLADGSLGDCCPCWPIASASTRRASTRGPTPRRRPTYWLR